MEQLFEFFKALLLIAGCLILITLIYAIISTPIKIAIQKKKSKDAFEKIKKSLKEMEEQEEKLKHKKEKTTEPKQKKTIKNKKTEKDVK